MNKEKVCCNCKNGIKLLTSAGVFWGRQCRELGCSVDPYWSCELFEEREAEEKK
jgi:hypothetical protein